MTLSFKKSVSGNDILNESIFIEGYKHMNQSLWILKASYESQNEVCFCILLDICDIIIMLRANLKHFKYVFFQDNRCSTIFKIICSFNFIIWASRNQEQHYLTNVAESELQETKNKIIFIFCCAICLRRKWLLFAFVQRS